MGSAVVTVGDGIAHAADAICSMVVLICFVYWVLA